MKSVYLETSFISLLVCRPSRDIIIAGNQQITREWWRLRRQDFLCVASSEVVREASRGDSGEVRKRMEILNQLPILAVSGDGERLSSALFGTGALPPQGQTDAAHLALSAVAKIDYLLTWNCRHLANVQILERLELEATKLGWKLPRVCTPAQLMGDLSDETGSDY
ncbi:MAG: DNA-binding protein [Verrucomicrobia bacterium]|nr:MAG: DNA-binding protein [Verrucomicrobiota bacterium]